MGTRPTPTLIWGRKEEVEDLFALQNLMCHHGPPGQALNVEVSFCTQGDESEGETMSG
jgi:hypothetical protein